MIRKRGLLKNVILFFALCVIVVLFGLNSAQAAKPIKIEFVSFVPLANKVEYQKLKDDFIDKVNERAKGEMIINVRGGPEAIPPFNLAVSVQKGIIDMATIPTAFLEALVPGANQTSLSDYTSIEERENGIYDYTRKMYQKRGIHYLGRSEATEKGYFYLYSKKKITKIEDFKKLKFGGSTAFHGLYHELGSSVVTLAIPEYHSAMERGVVDGLVTSLYVGVQFGLQEVSKVVIVPGFYRSTVVLPMNLKKWNKLPKHLQKVLTDTMIEFEQKFPSFETQQKAVFLEKIKKGGAELLQLSPEVEKLVQTAAVEGAWKEAQKRFPGDVIPNLRQKITKP